MFKFRFSVSSDVTKVVGQVPMPTHSKPYLIAKNNQGLMLLVMGHSEQPWQWYAKQLYMGTSISVCQQHSKTFEHVITCVNVPANFTWLQLERRL